jgi:hypothetical protein
VVSEPLHVCAERGPAALFDLLGAEGLVDLDQPA